MYIAVLTYYTDMPMRRVSHISCGLLLIDYQNILPWLRLRTYEINGLELARRWGPGSNWEDLKRSLASCLYCCLQIRLVASRWTSSLRRSPNR